MRKILETERLILRPLAEQDVPRIARLLANENIVGMLEQVPWPYTQADARGHVERSSARWQTGESYNFAIVLHGEDFIGTVGLDRLDNGNYDLGYWLGEPYWGHGYMSEAARAVMDWAHEDLGQVEIESGHFEDNPASQAVLTKLGFTPSGKVWHVDNAVRGQKVACLGMRWRAAAMLRAVNQ